jgi:hypothetical protein
MMILGVDYHPSFQQIAFLIEETGECGERRLNHEDGEAERFYRELKQEGISVRVGMEATGYSRWFERLLAGLGRRGQNRTTKTTLRSERSGALKKDLTGPTLLEMSD